MSAPNPSKTSLLLARFRGLIPFASGVFAAFVAIFIYNLLFLASPLSQRQVDQAIADALASATPRPAFSAAVYQTIQPSLVVIEAQDGDAQGGLGSGVIVNDAGEILTSLHVVAGASQIIVIFSDGTESPAVILSEQPEIDIAVLQAHILPEQWAPAILGNANSMRVGDEAYVVGHPFSLYASMSAGVISGFNRTFKIPDSNRVIEGLIQFDAAANPGNSGGPLLNRNGHVIGIVTGIVNPTDDNFFVGIGFAVPIGAAAGGGGSPPY